MPRHELWELRSMQAAPLNTKIALTKQRINEWVDEFGEDGVYVSFSGGKDSTVLLDIVREEYPDMPAVFVNTGLEYPSVRSFAISQKYVEEMTPTMSFLETISTYGYPVISKEVAGSVARYRSKSTGEVGKRFDGSMSDSPWNMSGYAFLLDAPFKISDQCCDMLKKAPAKTYARMSGRKPIVATMACESRLRKQKWLAHGCNAFDTEHPQSNPMAFWTEQDVLAYVHSRGLRIADAYGDVVTDGGKYDAKGQLNLYDITGDYTACKFRTTGCSRTGCIYCLFGIRSDRERMVNLAREYPDLCDYVMRGGELKDGWWQPKNGLGYWFICQWLNVHGHMGIELPEEWKTYRTNETDRLLKRGG